MSGVLNPELCRVIAELLAQRWSPAQIAGELRRQFPEQRSNWLCHESIYQGVYQPGSPLTRPSKVVSLQRNPLRTGRDHRRAHQRPTGRRPRFAQPMLSIHQRPFEPSDRSQAGHWEGDLIVGKNQCESFSRLSLMLPREHQSSSSECTFLVVTLQSRTRTGG